MEKDPFKEYLIQSEPDKREKGMRGILLLDSRQLMD